jgi:hypothetical protein
VKDLPRKYQKLVGDMNLVKGNINLTNEIIDGLQPSEKSETLVDLVNTLQSMESKLMNLIGQIENEDAMSVCLLVNDDLQATFKRYNLQKDGTKPPPFTPGESTKNTMLNPTHIYSRSASLPSQAAQKPPVIEDLFDIGKP